MLPCAYQCNPWAAFLISSLQKASFSEISRHIGISPWKSDKKKSHSKGFQSCLNRVTPENSPSTLKFAYFSNREKGIKWVSDLLLQVLASHTLIAEPTLELAGHGREVCFYGLYLHKHTHTHTYTHTFMYMYTYTRTSEKYSVKIEIFYKTNWRKIYVHPNLGSWRSTQNDLSPAQRFTSVTQS